MTWAERLAAVVIGAVLLSAGGYLAWAAGAEALLVTAGAVTMVVIGGICLMGAMLEGRHE